MPSSLRDKLAVVRVVPQQNQPKNKGAGNPPPKLGDGFSTSYLWREIWTKDRVLELMQYFVQDVRDRDEHGRLKRVVIFPRYHQLSAVRSLVADAREKGTGQDYLVQHSVGSGKSNSIGWLAHRLASLQRKSAEGAEHRRVFDSVIVVTNRVALDRQLSRTVARSSKRPAWSSTSRTGGS